MSKITQEGSLFVYNSTEAIENLWDKAVIPPKEQPFHVNFGYEDKWIEIQLVNGSDVFKLADVFADMLKKNDIYYTVFKSKEE
jgi:hypothetical protein